MLKSVTMLAGKLVIVTGGSSGIGEATCKVLTREGAKVVATGMFDEVSHVLLNDFLQAWRGDTKLFMTFALACLGRNEENLRKLKESGGCFDYVVGDLTKDGDCERIVNEGIALPISAFS
jgi:NAD(P)-dependent dehydrogenase (short-subunit alcohol dehydrogenase family)